MATVDKKKWVGKLNSPPMRSGLFLSALHMVSVVNQFWQAAATE